MQCDDEMQIAGWLGAEQHGQVDLLLGVFDGEVGPHWRVSGAESFPRYLPAPARLRSDRHGGHGSVAGRLSFAKFEFVRRELSQDSANVARDERTDASDARFRIGNF